MPKKEQARHRPPSGRRNSPRPGRLPVKLTVHNQPSAAEEIAIWRAFLRDEIDAILYS
jgi:hypothetical protein